VGWDAVTLGVVVPALLLAVPGVSRGGLRSRAARRRPARPLHPPGFALTAMAVAAIGRRVFGSVRPEAEPGIVPPAAARTPAA